MRLNSEQVIDSLLKNGWEKTWTQNGMTRYVKSNITGKINEYDEGNGYKGHVYVWKDEAHILIRNIGDAEKKR